MRRQRLENLQRSRSGKLSWRWRRRRIIFSHWWAEIIHHVGKLLCQKLLEATVGELRAGVETGLWRWGQRQTTGL